MYSFVVGKNWFFAKHYNHRSLHQPYMHVDIVLALSLLYSVTMPAYSMCWPVSGCNVLCCRLLKWWIRCDRSLFCTQLCHWSWWTHLPSKLPHLFSLDGLQPWFIYAIILFMRTRCNKCVIALCYKSFKYCVCQHYWSRDDTGAQRSDCLRSGRYRDGIRAHTDCRTRPLS